MMPWEERPSRLRVVGWWLFTLAVTVGVTSAYVMAFPYLTGIVQVLLGWLGETLVALIDVALALFGIALFGLIPYWMLPRYADTMPEQLAWTIIVAPLLTMFPHW